MRRLFLIVLVLAMSGAVGGCGFKLRGAYTLPFDTLYIAYPENTPLYSVLKRGIEASTQTRIVTDKKKAQASFVVVGDVQAQNILALDTAGNVAEYQLVRTFSFRVNDAADHELIPPSAIAIHRDVSFNNAQALAKESEDALLWRDIENDLVQQILRRLATAKPKPAEEDR